MDVQLPTFAMMDERTEIVEPFNGNALEYLQSIYRDPTQEQFTRMRAARDAIAYESPKLVATAVIDGKDFATLLDRRIAHMRKVEAARIIDAKPVEPKPKPAPTGQIKPYVPTVPDKRYRRI